MSNSYELALERQQRLRKQKASRKHKGNVIKVKFKIPYKKVKPWMPFPQPQTEQEVDILHYQGEAAFLKFLKRKTKARERAEELAIRMCNRDT